MAENVRVSSYVFFGNAFLTRLLASASSSDESSSSIDGGVLRFELEQREAASAAGVIDDELVDTDAAGTASVATAVRRDGGLSALTWSSSDALVSDALDPDALDSDALDSDALVSNSLTSFHSGGPRRAAM